MDFDEIFRKSHKVESRNDKILVDPPSGSRYFVKGFFVITLRSTVEGVGPWRSYMLYEPSC